jgi:hypothetical protein
MPELPSCLCISGYPPYDRLTFIYQAAAELSGDDTLPDVLCVAALPPFDRFSYIYAAFRVLAGDDSLPSQECIESETYQDQVTRIYEAVRAYAGDDTLPEVRCVRGTPIWQQWHSIYEALYVSIGSPDDLTDPACLSGPFGGLSESFCALVSACEIPVLVSSEIDATVLILVFSENVTGFNGFSLEIAGGSVTLTYVSGEGTNTLVFEADPPGANPGDEVLLDYIPGNVTNRDCPLAPFEDVNVTNNTGTQFSYFRPGGVDTYLRPDGTSIYIRP